MAFATLPVIVAAETIDDEVFREEGINIANMSLSRNKVGGEALSILNVDSIVDEETLGKIGAIPGIRRATTVVL